MFRPAAGVQALKKLPKSLQKWSKDPKASFRLTKMEQKHEHSFVPAGRVITGSLDFVEIDKSPCVRITRGMSDYIRTSPFVRLVNETSNSITFETEGGFYHIEKLED